MLAYLREPQRTNSAEFGDYFLYYNQQVYI